MTMEKDRGGKAWIALVKNPSSKPPPVMTAGASSRYAFWCDFRLGVRVLRPERLPRRAASAARLVGHADFGRDDLLLFVRRAHRCLCQRGGARVWSAPPPGRRDRFGWRSGCHDSPGLPAVAAVCFAPSLCI